MKKKIRKIAVLASGNGTTLQAVINAIETEVLDMHIVAVISDRDEAYALTRADIADIVTYVLAERDEDSRDYELFDMLRRVCAELVVLAGYLKPIGPKVLDNFVVINTYPSLLPKYGGKGKYGMNVHQAVVDNKETVTGVTIHFVNSKYGEGPIIWQTPVPVYPEDDAYAVSERVKSAEKTQLVSTLKDFGEGKIAFPK